MRINKITLSVFSVRAGSNCWLQCRQIFSKPVKFYGINIAYFMPRMNEKVLGTTLHERPTLRGINLFCTEQKKSNWMKIKKPTTLLKWDSNTGVFLWKLRNFLEPLFWRAFINGSFLNSFILKSTRWAAAIDCFINFKKFINKL